MVCGECVSCGLGKSWITINRSILKWIKTFSPSSRTFITMRFPNFQTNPTNSFDDLKFPICTCSLNEQWTENLSFNQIGNLKTLSRIHLEAAHKAEVKISSSQRNSLSRRFSFEEEKHLRFNNSDDFLYRITTIRRDLHWRFLLSDPKREDSEKMQRH